MTTYTLTYGPDAESGVDGFKLDGVKSYAANMASEGLLIAHDILEHARLKDIGTIGDELMALGGVWFVRGQHGELNRNGRGSRFSPEENLASDLINMGRDIVLGWKKYHAKVPRLAACEERDALNSVVDYARQGLPAELEGEEWTRQALEAYLRDALAFMVRGYNHAKRRYARYPNRYTANNAFWAIAQAVDGALKEAAGYGEGVRFKLQVNLGQARAFCEMDYSDY